jgi:hypothetical protein
MADSASPTACEVILGNETRFQPAYKDMPSDEVAASEGLAEIRVQAVVAFTQ